MPELPRTADVVIVGGGIIGLSVAYHLGERGVRGLVLERARLGQGSTARSSGGIRRLFDTEPAIRLTVESVRFWDRFEEYTGQNLDWQRVGYLLVARSDASRRQLGSAWPLQQQWGVPSVKLAAEDVRRLVPAMRSEDVVMALHCPTDGYADPHQALQAFRTGAVRRGGIVVEDCEVTGVRIHVDRVVGVQTPRGQVDAPIVVNAAGAWAPLVGRFVGQDIAVLPRRQHQWVIQVPGVAFTMPCTLDLDSTLYVRPEGDKFLWGIASEEPSGSYDISVRPEAFLAAAEEAMRRFPVFENARLVRTWAGLYDETPDHHPLLGPCGPEGFVVAAGFSGHGFMQAPAAGLLVAEYLTQGRAETIPLDPFLPARFARTGSPAAEG